MNTPIVSKFVRVLSAAVAASLLFAGVVGAGPAQFVIINLNAPGVGFNDPTPRAPVGGNTGTTLGEQRRIAFQHAASIWSATLDSTVPIRIRAQFAPLGANVLGSAGPIVRFRDFDNAPLAGTWYHVALANMLAGFDLMTVADTQALGIDPAFSDDIVATSAPTSTSTWAWTTTTVRSTTWWRSCSTSSGTVSASASRRAWHRGRCSVDSLTPTTASCSTTAPASTGRR